MEDYLNNNNNNNNHKRLLEEATKEREDKFYRTFSPLSNLHPFHHELSSNRLHDFDYIKKLIDSDLLHLIEQALFLNAETGIPRNVEYMLPWLLEHGHIAQINEAFCIATENGHVAIMELLFNVGADITYENNRPLRLSINKYGHRALEFLLKNGANANLDDGILLVKCCKLSDNTKMISLLLEKGANVRCNGDQPLLEAIGNGRVETTRLLVEHGADLNANEGNLGLQCCKWNEDHVKILRLLLEYNYDLSKNYGMIMRTFLNQNLRESMNLLIQYNIDLEEKKSKEKKLLESQPKSPSVVRNDLNDTGTIEFDDDMNEDFSEDEVEDV
jgi:ankyrin repeat protein